MAAGIYHYQALAHALAPVAPGDARAAVARASLHQSWMAAAPACWLLIETFADYRPIFYTVIALNVIVTISLVFGLRRARQRTMT